MTEFEEYQQTGMLGTYKPEYARKTVTTDGKVIPMYRDTAYFERDDSCEVCREMVIGSRLFRIHSVFESKAKKTPTEAMLRVIDSDLEKDSHSE